MSSSSSREIGLIGCSNDPSSAFCIVKAAQFTMSGILLLITLAIFLQRSRREREWNFFVMVSIEMILTLIFNMLYSLIHTITAFYDFETFFFDAYFITIVYQVSLRLVKQADLSRKYVTALHCIFAGYLLINIAVYVVDIVVDSDRCAEIQYLVMDFIAIILSILLIIAGIRFHRLQKKRLVGIHGEAHIKNPLPVMWIWIVINIVCQVISFVESIVFQFLLTDCKFSENPTVDLPVKFVFAVFTYYIAMIVTLAFFKQKYLRPKFIMQNSLRKDSTDDEGGNVELIIRTITPRSQPPELELSITN